jgi:hypothetical protein
MATEAVLFGKLGENEVVESINWARINRRNYTGLNTLPAGTALMGLSQKPFSAVIPSADEAVVSVAMQFLSSRLGNFMIFI